MVSDSEKTVLITGATGKIGRAVCLELARMGYDVIVHYCKSKDRALEIIEMIETLKRRALALEADLSKPKKCEALVQKIYREFGFIDTFIHCASVYKEMPFGSIEPEQWDQQTAVNLRAPFLLTQAIGSRMAAEKRSGSIILFSDVSANRPYGGHIPYCMSKAAIEAMVKGAAVQLAPLVKVNTIAPYLVRESGELNDAEKALVEKMPLKRCTTPEEIVSLIRLLIDDSSTITGQVIAVDGGRSLVW